VQYFWPFEADITANIAQNALTLSCYPHKKQKIYHLETRDFMDFSHKYFRPKRACLPVIQKDKQNERTTKESSKEGKSINGPYDQS
jgi:hypothetical protein